VDNHGKLPLEFQLSNSFWPTQCIDAKVLGENCSNLSNRQERVGIRQSCAQMKCNFTYWLHQNCNKPFHIFVYCVACVLEHHFGNHKFCKGKKEGGWCKYKGDEEMMVKANRRTGTITSTWRWIFMLQVLAIQHQYAMEEMLRQSHHLYWCQKSKSLNQLVAVLSPKDKQLSGSKLLSNHVSLVVIVDSIGFLQGFHRVFMKSWKK